MQSHTDLDDCFAPIFSLQSALRLKRGVESIHCRVEGCTERIPDDLEHIALIGFDGRPQNGMVLRPHGFPFVRMRLCEPGRAFDIGKQESHGTKWVGTHKTFSRLVVIQPLKLTKLYQIFPIFPITCSRHSSPGKSSSPSLNKLPSPRGRAGDGSFPRTRDRPPRVRSTKTA